MTAVIIKPMSHQTVIPQRLYSVLKPCQHAVGSPRNTPKNIKFVSYSVYTTSSQRHHNVPTASLQHPWHFHSTQAVAMHALTAKPRRLFWACSAFCNFLKCCVNAVRTPLWCDRGFTVVMNWWIDHVIRITKSVCLPRVRAENVVIYTCQLMPITTNFKNLIHRRFLRESEKCQVLQISRQQTIPLSKLSF